jgi:hypothetical protein
VAVLDFAMFARGFSPMASSVLLCAFAALRESNSFWEKPSRKAT